MPVITGTSHGESRVRMLRLIRRGDRHDPRDLSVSIRYEGEFAPAFSEGRAAGVVPGETLKTLVYTAARVQTLREIEEFGLDLCARVLAAHPHLALVRVDVAEQPWQRVEVGGKAMGQAFILGGPEQRTSAVTSNGRKMAVVSGIENLTVMRSAGFTTPRRPAQDDADDSLPPLLVGSLSVRWTYSTPDVTFGAYRQGVRAAVLETIALHASRSVQYTLHSLGDVLLASYPEISVVTLTMHERPYRPVDLFHANVENPDDLFVAREEPVSLVEVTLERERVS
jgi:urate oxidase